MLILWHDNHRKWFRLLRDVTPWSWLWYPQTPQFSPFLCHFQSKPGHVPRCINRSVLHLRRPTNISVYTPAPMHILWHDNHRKWFRLLRDMTPWSWHWYPQKTSFFTILGQFLSKPGHVPRCINRSVLHLRGPTKISIYTLYPGTYYDMTTIGNDLDYFEIWPLEVDFGTFRKPSIFTIWAIFGPNRDMFRGVLTVAFCISGNQLIYQYIPCTRAHIVTWQP